MSDNKKVIRTRVEWTVDNRTNSSFLLMDALGGMLRGKVEINKAALAVLDGYDVVKWMVDLSNGTTEEFDNREDLLTRFNAVDLSNPEPQATEVDWKIDISSEDSGVLRLWLHKELHEGTIDPEPGVDYGSALVSVSPVGSRNGLIVRAKKHSGGSVDTLLESPVLSEMIPLWCADTPLDINKADLWLYIITEAMDKASPNVRANFMAEIMNGMNGRSVEPKGD